MKTLILLLATFLALPVWAEEAAMPHLTSSVRCQKELKAKKISNGQILVKSVDAKEVSMSWEFQGTRYQISYLFDQKTKMENANLYLKSKTVNHPREDGSMEEERSSFSVAINKTRGEVVSLASQSRQVAESLADGTVNFYDVSKDGTLVLAAVKKTVATEDSGKVIQAWDYPVREQDKVKGYDILSHSATCRQGAFDGDLGKKEDAFNLGSRRLFLDSAAQMDAAMSEVMRSQENLLSCQRGAANCVREASQFAISWNRLDNTWKNLFPVVQVKKLKGWKKNKPAMPVDGNGNGGGKGLKPNREADIERCSMSLSLNGFGSSNPFGWVEICKKLY